MNGGCSPEITTIPERREQFSDLVSAVEFCTCPQMTPITPMVLEAEAVGFSRP